MAVVPDTSMDQNITYPYARRGKELISVGKQSVPDPYQYLEDMGSKETTEYVDAQNQIAQDYLEDCKYRQQLFDTASKLARYSKATLPYLQKDGYIYWTFSDGTHAHPIFYRQKYSSSENLVLTNENNDKEVFFDPNTLSQKGEISIHNYSWSDSGKYFSYATSEGGSDFQKIYVMDSYTKKLFPEVLVDSRFTFKLEWYKDQGFLYKRMYNFEGNVIPSLFYHKVGTFQDEDIMVWRQPGKELKFAGLPRFNQDYTNLFVDVYSTVGPECTVYVSKVEEDARNIHSLNFVMVNKEPEDGAYWYIGSIEGKAIFNTTIDKCSNYKLISVEYDQKDTTKISDLISHHSSNVLVSAQLFANWQLAIVYSIDAAHYASIWDGRTGQKIRDIGHEEIPQGSAINEAHARPDDDTVYFTYETFFGPTTISKGKFDGQKTNFDIVFQPKIEGLDPSDYITEQIFYSSKDGTQIPMYLCHDKSLDLTKLDKPVPTLLHSYGGFGVPVLPSFSTFFAGFIKVYGGILAVPGIRGGGEYGRKWHEAAEGVKRQVGWDDFQYGARYLLDKGITVREKLTTWGTSNGGLLVAISMIQSPELFGCVIPDVGVFDLLRYHTYSFGSLWKSEYGDPDDENVFKVLKNKSPVHNVGQDDQVKYPPVLLTTGDHDNRVIPCHSFKMVASLQYARSNDGVPIIMRVYKDRGHGLGKTTDMLVEEAADRLCFISKTLDLVPANK